MTTVSAIRVRDPPRWQDAERIGRVSYLPPKSMARTYRSELRRRELMAAEAAEFQTLYADIAERERSDAALLSLATAFAALFCVETEPEPAIEVADAAHRKTGNSHYEYGNTRGN